MNQLKLVAVVLSVSLLGLYGVTFQSVEITLPRDEREQHVAREQISTSAVTPSPTTSMKVEPVVTEEGSFEADEKHSGSCTYTKGKWVGNLTWVPEVPVGCEYKTYTQDMAFQCLAGKQIILIGNSNMRALYSALEGVLKNKIITPRLEAKQTCENNQKNHSCGMVVTHPGYKGVRLWYWGYIKGVFNHRIPGFFKHEKTPHVVLINSGLNVIQKVKEKDWKKSIYSEVPQLRNYIKEGFTDKTSWYWVTTTRICEDQPHFKKYLYKPKYWLHRSLTAMNAEVSLHNSQVVQELAGSLPIVDAAQLASDPSLCPFYDDPLHHKAVDTVIANIFLNNYCN